MNYTYQFPRPSVTVDVIVFHKTSGRLSVLLIKRGHPPFENCYALPGGFLDMDETLEESAIRELLEETGLVVEQLQEVKSFSSLGRDPRGRTITVVFYTILKGKQPETAAGDDASEAKWFAVDNLPDLAFDHQEIMKYAIKKLSAELETKTGM